MSFVNFVYTSWISPQRDPQQKSAFILQIHVQNRNHYSANILYCTFGNLTGVVTNKLPHACHNTVTFSASLPACQSADLPVWKLPSQGVRFATTIMNVELPWNFIQFTTRKTASQLSFVVWLPLLWNPLLTDGQEC